LDCGPRIPEAIERAGRQLIEVDVWAITHLDGAHIGGLEEVAIRMRYEYGKKPVLMAPGKILDGLRDTLMPSLIQAEKRHRGGAVTFDDFFEVTSSRQIKLKEEDGFSETISLVPHDHISSSTSYGVLFEDHKIFITGAKKFDKKWLVFNGRDAKVVCYDIMMDSGHWAHSLVELGQLPAAIKDPIWLYGLNQQTIKRLVSEISLLEQHVCIFDDDRKMPWLMKQYKKSIKSAGSQNLNGNQPVVLGADALHDQNGSAGN
jgi:hypothetical protein